jgi:hypothetical protein
MVLAHAFGQRFDLPLPLLYYILGGAVVVFASFLLVLPGTVAAAAGEPPADRVPAQRPRPVPGALGLVLLGGLVFAGITGSQTVPENIVPTWIWLVVWIAVPLSCGVLGDWTRTVNPFAALARLADSERARRMLLGSERRIGWPARLGWWPAVVSFFVAACGELVYNQTATLPRVTAYALLSAAILSVVMGLLFGADEWLNHGELFSVLYSTWGRLGFFRFGALGRRGFARGLDVPFEPSGPRIAFVLMLLVSVSFDGLISTPGWRGVHTHISHLTGGSAPRNDLLTALVFLGLAAATFVVFGLFATAVARAGGHDQSFAASLAALLPSLLPIAFGYLLAHNLQYLVINGQLLVPLAGNPAGFDGVRLLPAPFNDGYQIHTKLLPPSFYWYSAVAVIVAVHVTAVVIAHRHLRRSEWPWVVAMICYTMASLWLLAQPLVADKPAEPAKTASAIAMLLGEHH